MARPLDTTTKLPFVLTALSVTNPTRAEWGFEGMVGNGGKAIS